MIRVYHNPRCGKSREAIQKLREKETAFDTILYMDSPITVEDMERLVSKLGLPAEALIRKNEAIYKQQFAGKKLSEHEWIQAMIHHPALMQRPIVETNSSAVIARPSSAMDSIL
jgi:arsenate reductase (glutaredoxin)